VTKQCTHFTIQPTRADGPPQEHRLYASVREPLGIHNPGYQTRIQSEGPAEEVHASDAQCVCTQAPWSLHSLHKLDTSVKASCHQASCTPLPDGEAMWRSRRASACHAGGRLSLEWSSEVSHSLVGMTKAHSASAPYGAAIHSHARTSAREGRNVHVYRHKAGDHRADAAWRTYQYRSVKRS